MDKALPQEFGIPREDAEFLANFRGMIIARVVDDERELKQEIYSEIMRGYRQYGSRLSARQEFATDRERLLAYIMLRVNGSMPIFNPLAAPKELSDILAKKDGNCGPVSTRLLMILDVFGIKARAIRWFSPSLPGHVFVDAYDPLEGKAYLLDSNYNIMSIMEHGEKGFVDSIALMEPEDRKRYFLNEMVSFPFYFSDVNNVKMDDDLFREKEYLKIHDALITALSYEMGAAMVEWKKRYPRGIPYTLSTLAGNDPEVRKFNSQHALPIDGLLLSAGIEADAAVQNNVGNKTAIEGSQ